MTNRAEPEPRLHEVLCACLVVWSLLTSCAETPKLVRDPEPVVVLWSGSLSDVPPPLKLPAIVQTGEFCTCCSGFMCPDGSCKPNLNQCDVMPPAVK